MELGVAQAGLVAGLAAMVARVGLVAPASLGPQAEQGGQVVLRVLVGWAVELGAE